MPKLAKCPSCLIKVDIGEKPQFGQQIKCPDCDTVLEIIQVNPPLLDCIFDEGDDYYISGKYIYDEIYFERHL